MLLDEIHRLGKIRNVRSFLSAYMNDLTTDHSVTFVQEDSNNEGCVSIQKVTTPLPTYIQLGKEARL